MSESTFAEPPDGATKCRVEEMLRGYLGGLPESELWGENGLVAATMRCVEAVGKLEDMYTRMDPKGFFARKIAKILGQRMEAASPRQVLAETCSPKPFDLVFLHGHTDSYRCYSHGAHMIYAGQNSDTVRTSDDAEVASIIKENAETEP